MPELKQLHAHLELADPNGPKTPLREYNTTYADGVVNTFVAVPDRPEPFCIKFCSDGYIATGLAAFVFIDGEYQCNFVRRGLIPPAEGVSPNETNVHFIFRGQVVPDGRKFKMRPWKFDKLNIGDADAMNAPPRLDSMGTIAIIVLRCKSDSRTDFQNVPKSMTSRPVPVTVKTTQISDKATPMAPSVQANDDGGSVGGFGGLFDGPSDDRRYRSHVYSRDYDERRKHRRSERRSRDDANDTDGWGVEPHIDQHPARGRNREGPGRLREVLRSPDRDPSSHSPSRHSHRRDGPHSTERADRRERYNETDPSRHSRRHFIPVNQSRRFTNSGALEGSSKPDRRRIERLAYDGDNSSEGADSWTRETPQGPPEGRRLKHYDPTGERLGVWSPRSSDSYVSKKGIKTYPPKNKKDIFDSDPSAVSDLRTSRRALRAAAPARPRAGKRPDEYWPTSKVANADDSVRAEPKVGLHFANPDHWEIHEERATRGDRFTHPSHAFAATKRHDDWSRYNIEEESNVNDAEGWPSNSENKGERNYSGPSFSEMGHPDEVWVPHGASEFTNPDTPQGDDWNNDAQGATWAEPEASETTGWSQKAMSIAKWTEDIQPDDSASNPGRRSFNATRGVKGQNVNFANWDGNASKVGSGSRTSKTGRQRPDANKTAPKPNDRKQGQAAGDAQSPSQGYQTSLLRHWPSRDNGGGGGSGGRKANSKDQRPNTNPPVLGNNNSQNQLTSGGWDNGGQPGQTYTASWDTNNDNGAAASGWGENGNVTTEQNPANAGWGNDANTPVDQDGNNSGCKNNANTAVEQNQGGSDWENNASAPVNQDQNNSCDNNTGTTVEQSQYSGNWQENDATQGQDNFWGNNDTTQVGPGQGTSDWDNDNHTSGDQDQGNAGNGWNNNKNSSGDQSQGNTDWDSNNNSSENQGQGNGDGKWANAEDTQPNQGQGVQARGNSDSNTAQPDKGQDNQNWNHDDSNGQSGQDQSWQHGDGNGGAAPEQAWGGNDDNNSPDQNQNSKEINNRGQQLTGDNNWGNANAIPQPESQQWDNADANANAIPIDPNPWENQNTTTKPELAPVVSQNATSTTVNIPGTNDCTQPTFIPPWSTPTWAPPALPPVPADRAPGSGTWEVPYTVPSHISAEKSLDVQCLKGPVRSWVWETATPTYMDSIERPYAVFTFQYRSRGMLEGILGRSVEESEGEKKARLLAMSKEEIVEELMRVQRGGE